MSHKIRTYFLAIKYWLQGDSWKFAIEYAKAITNFKNMDKK